MRALLSKQEEPSPYQSIGNYFSHVLRSNLPTPEKRLRVNFTLFLKTSISTNEAHISSSCKQRVFILFGNLVPRALSSTFFKMADRREKTLAKDGSRGTKSPMGARSIRPKIPV